MPKIVYNACYGGFSLSHQANEMLKKIKNDPDLYDRGISRHDPDLIKVIEILGLKKASGNCAKLAFEELPSGSQYRIDEYDGMESVATRDSYEWITVP